MKKILFLFLAVGIVFGLSNCSKDDEDDLTKDITGIYTGGFGSSVSGSMDNFMIEVTRSTTNRVRVAPANGGTTFAAYEFDVEQVNSSTINSTDPSAANNATFTIGVPIGCSLTRTISGEVISYVGAKQ